ncbi:pyruvate dehydrogenase (acetyl-transferring) E1 component subunit alpha [Nakamurella sp. YIM 132087]|uniref:2-oxoisovalerate dehydrogenase subunit alpha n=1 Tax=Nakamurella alba TaxID=2665158 RepID=A0A7K1FKN0_9ACTN|nr:thiamine pyrophosphate-dependent enzyme [Nakamurella alba]MTD14701.1 pyruvate dehydrogenase (acetyl-transferring) E1 component subunit alpha [Nakamurella alba]
MKPVQLLDPAGDLHPHPDWPLDITPELTRDLYRKMRLARRLDEEALALQRQGELGLWLQVLGQEASQVGSITGVRASDHVFPSYREHAAAMCRGITPAELLIQWRGNAHSGWDPERYRFHIYTLVLAAQLLHATGYAMGVQRDGADELVLTYFGDGSSSEGDANEAFNWAAAAGAPVLFFCQNNGWAISTPPQIQMRAPLHQRAAGFGLDAHLVDGNDVLAVHAVTRGVADQVRSGSGPAFIEAITYRMAGHSTSDDPGRYRTDSEVDGWRTRDPLARMELLLEKQGWSDAAYLSELDLECKELGTEVRRICKELPLPELDERFDQVLAERPELLTEQRAGYRDLVASFVD